MTLLWDSLHFAKMSIDFDKWLRLMATGLVTTQRGPPLIGCLICQILCYFEIHRTLQGYCLILALLSMFGYQLFCQNHLCLWQKPHLR